MKDHLTERLVKNAAGKPGRDVTIFDDEVAGFGLCIYASGNRAFTLTYRISGRQRRYTIGSWPDWSVSAAREEAKVLKRDIDRGHDPQGARKEAREAETVSQMIDRYIDEHLPKLAPRNASDQTSMLRNLVEPEWGNRKVAEISSADVDRLLAKIAAGRARPHKAKPKNKRRKALAQPKPTPVRANRVGEVLRKMFGLAVHPWKMRSDNPAISFARRPENEREYYLTLEQAGRLAEELAATPDQVRADALRLLMVTGARQGEVLRARKDQFNLDLLFWAKQSAHTKQRKIHRAPISPEAAAIVARRIAAVPADCPYLFPQQGGGGATGFKPISDPRRFWAAIRKKACIPADFRKNDLRHTFASLLISGGSSLEMVGKLLGHTQIKTTQRYAHLFDSPVRAGANAVGEALRPKLRVVGGEDRAAG